MEQIKGKKIKKRKKSSFRVFACKIIDLFLGDPHLSSIDGGRGAPVSCIFQMKEKKRESSTFCSVSFRYSM
jgi:hypothetical protein